MHRFCDQYLMYACYFDICCYIVVIHFNLYKGIYSTVHYELVLNAILTCAMKITESYIYGLHYSHAMVIVLSFPVTWVWRFVSNLHCMQFMCAPVWDSDFTLLLLPRSL